MHILQDYDAVLLWLYICESCDFIYVRVVILQTCGKQLHYSINSLRGCPKKTSLTPTFLIFLYIVILINNTITYSKKMINFTAVVLEDNLSFYPTSTKTSNTYMHNPTYVIAYDHN